MYVFLIIAASMICVARKADILYLVRISEISFDKLCRNKIEMSVSGMQIIILNGDLYWHVSVQSPHRVIPDLNGYFILSAMVSTLCLNAFV